MTDSTFNKAVASDGGELDASASENPANREVLLYLRNAFKAMGNSAIYCGLVKNRNFNACAFRRADRTFIGLNSGALRVLLASSFSLLSNRSVFLDIGSPAEEQADWDMSDGCLGLLMFPQPRCPKRNRFARSLFQFASTFIFCHEFGHHWAGHVDFVFRNNQHGKVYETSSDATYSDLAARTKQALELDADRAAVAVYVCSLFDLVDTFETPLEAFRVWMTAMFLVFSVLGEATGSISSYEGNTHPHPWLRLLFVMTHACHEVSQRTRQSQETLEAVAMEAFGDVQKAWIQLRIPGYQIYENSSRSRYKSHLRNGIRDGA